MLATLSIWTGCLALFLSTDSPVAEGEAGDLRWESFSAPGPRGSTIDGELGRLLVPENRSDPDSRLIEIAFFRIPSTSENPGPPIVMLAGGPGGSGIPIAVAFGTDPVYGWRNYGDVIGLDQRGVGLSRPNLESPEGMFLADIAFDEFMDASERLQASLAVSRDCIEYWTEQGVDLASYNTQESADDVNDVRLALGAEKVVLHGNSYGSHLGLAILRRHGEHVERALLSKVEGPDHTFKLPSTIQAHLEQLDGLIQENEALSAKIPDFLGMVEELIDQFDEEPVWATTTNPATGKEQRVVITADDLRDAIINQLGYRSRLEQLPASLWRIAQGDYDEIAAMTLAGRSFPLYSAMQMRMDAASGATEARRRRIAAEAKEFILGDAANFAPEVAALWGTPDLGDSFRGPMTCDVPVLFVSGTLDARTPVQNVEEILDGFSKAAHVIVENCGHAPMEFRSSEMRDLMTHFFQGKLVDSTRVSLPPLNFEIP